MLKPLRHSYAYIHTYMLSWKHTRHIYLRFQLKWHLLRLYKTYAGPYELYYFLYDVHAHQKRIYLVGERFQTGN